MPFTSIVIIVLFVGLVVSIVYVFDLRDQIRALDKGMDEVVDNYEQDILTSDEKMYVLEQNHEFLYTNLQTWVKNSDLNEDEREAYMLEIDSHMQHVVETNSIYTL